MNALLTSLPLPEGERVVERANTRLLVSDPLSILDFDAFPSLLGPGDLLVLNDAATFPGSLRFTWAGERLEARLFEKSARGFHAVLFGPGDFHTRTEHRAPPPVLPVGTRLELAGLEAELVSVSSASPRLVELAFEGVTEDEQWAAVYAHGRVIQYAHRRQALPLWSVQNVYSARPWAAEQPSAGHAVRFETLRALGARGVKVATLTHATGLSSTGDAALDALLPFPERYEVPAATRKAVADARRVVAVGTSVVRALEAWASTGETAGVATARIEGKTRLRVVDALLTGIHSPGESHYLLLEAFLGAGRLRELGALAASEQLETHENGDLALLWRAR